MMNLCKVYLEKRCIKNDELVVNLNTLKKEELAILKIIVTEKINKLLKKLAIVNGYSFANGYASNIKIEELNQKLICWKSNEQKIMDKLEELNISEQEK